jgi:hypothetical protein
VKTIIEAWMTAFFIGLTFAISSILLFESNPAQADTATPADPQTILEIKPGMYTVPRTIDGKANGLSEMKTDEDDDGNDDGPLNGDSFCNQDSGYSLRWENRVGRGPMLIIGLSIPTYSGFNSGVITDTAQAYDSANCVHSHEAKMAHDLLRYDSWTKCDAGTTRQHIEIQSAGDRLTYTSDTSFTPAKTSADQEEVKPSHQSCVLVREPDAPVKKSPPKS